MKVHMFVTPSQGVLEIYPSRTKTTDSLRVSSTDAVPTHQTRTQGRLEVMELRQSFVFVLDG